MAPQAADAARRRKTVPENHTLTIDSALRIGSDPIANDAETLAITPPSFCRPRATIVLVFAIQARPPTELRPGTGSC
jgi:hypothetical protein